MKIAEGSFYGMHDLEIELLKRHLSNLTGQAVEIGCCDGYSSAHILAMSKLVLTSVDPFVPDSMTPCLIGSVERFMQNVADFSDRSVLLKMTSAQAVQSWSTPLDFVYIDGDHTYEAVLFDFTAWSAHLKSGALLAMHDSRMHRHGGAPFHPGPSRVASELVYGNTDQWRVLGEAFSMTLAQKR